MKKNKEFPVLLTSLTILIIGTAWLCELKLGGYTMMTKIWFVDSQPYFQDLKVLLDGISQFRAGDSPYQHIGSPFNYPVGWSLFSTIPFLKPENLKILGFMQALLFFLLCLWIFKKFKTFETLSSLILFSPPVLFALERGNCDVFIFLLLGTTFMASKNQTTQLYAVLSAALLKIFPLGAVLGLITKKDIKKKLLTKQSFAVFAFFLVGTFLSLQSFTFVSERTPRPIHFMSYGLCSLPSLFSTRAGFHVEQKIITIIIFYCSVFFVSLIIWKMDLCKNFKKSQSDSQQLFFVGLGCFILSNLIGFNWEYRLIFLIFCLPEIIYQKKFLKHQFWIIYSLLLLLFWQSFFNSAFNIIFQYLPYKTNHFYVFSDLINIVLFIFSFSLALTFLEKNRIFALNHKSF